MTNHRCSRSSKCKVKLTEVRIANKANIVFKLGQKTTVECQVFGSKPSASVRWFRGAEELDVLTLQQTLSNDNYPLQGDQTNEQKSYISEFNRDTNNLTKSSYLTIIPKLSDHQQSLTCSAGNPKMPNVPQLSDNITMNVHCEYSNLALVLHQHQMTLRC